MSGPKWEEMEAERDRELARRVAREERLFNEELDREAAGTDLELNVRAALRKHDGKQVDDIARAVIITVLDDLMKPTAEACEVAGQIKETEMNGPYRLSLAGWQAYEHWQAMLTAKRRELGL